MNQNLKDIELVIFDCDGVLVDTEQIANRVFIHEISKFGFKLTAEEAWAHFPGSRFLACVEYVERTNGRKVPADFLDIYRKASAEAFANEVEAIPGIDLILSNLASPKVVASNGPMHAIVSNLTTAKLIQHFHPNHLFSAYTRQKWKPDPDLHLSSAEALGVPPGNSVVIEDSVPGIEAAIAAGMQVIGFTHDGRNDKLAPLNVPKIDHMEELIDYLPMNKSSNIKIYH